MKLGKYFKKKAKSRYKLYKQEKLIKQREAKQLRTEVLKVRLKTRKEQAIKFAREKEIIKSKRKLALLKRPVTRGYAPLFSRRSVLIKPRKRRKKVKKKRKKK